MPKLSKWEIKHLQNIQRYERQIEKIFQSAAQEAASIGAVIGDFSPDKPFSFADYPSTRKRIEKLLKTLKSEMQTVVLNGIDVEWTLANNKNSELANQVFGSAAKNLTEEQSRRYYRTNDVARQAFAQRKVAGLNLSDRVWRYTDQFKEEIEMGLDLGLRDGLSADEMSRSLRQFLRHPDKLFRRVRDEHGVLHLSKAAKAFHPGQGVYRSSYKNARRLAATETNIAYRTSDYVRWQQLDFVVGIEVRLSNNHTLNGVPLTDICDTLKGKYPKDFKFTGWHPHCRCHAVPILKTPEEMAADNERIMNGEPLDGESVNKVTGVPARFDEWIADNKERAKGWSSMPYFVRQNPKYIQGFEVDTYTPTERKFTRARRTSEAMRESAGLYVQSLYPEIPTTEKAAIYHYTQGEKSTFRQLNKHLREGADLNGFEAAFSELLSQALSKMEATTGKVYRTIRLNRTNFAKWIADAQAMKDTTFEAFSSTSRSLDVVMLQMKKGNRKKNETDILLIIEGRSGRYISDLSEFSGRKADKYSQQEVLFDKGAKFHFEKVEMVNNLWHFWLTEI